MPAIKAPPELREGLLGSGSAIRRLRGRRGPRHNLGAVSGYHNGCSQAGSPVASSALSDLQRLIRANNRGMALALFSYMLHMFLDDGSGNHHGYRE